MFDFFGVKVKQMGAFVHVTGVSFRALSSDIGRFYSTSLIEKYFMQRESWDTFRVHNFFLVELEEILKVLLGLSNLRSRRRELKELQQLLVTETWLKDTVTPIGRSFDFTRMKAFKTTLLPEQREFLETYPLIKASYHLKGLLLDAKAGVGKAMPLDTLVKVPGGWKPIGDLKIGDTVVGPKGNLAKVKGTHLQGVTRCHRFEFEDGRHADSHPLHLWDVSESILGARREDRRRHVTTTQDIINNFDQFDYHIPLVDKIDGCITTSFHSVGEWSTRLFEQEIIDDEVLELSYNERFSILKNMLALSDWRVIDSRVYFETTSLRTVRNFQRLLWSLGGVCAYALQGDVYRASVRHKALLELVEGILPPTSLRFLRKEDYQDLQLKIDKITEQEQVETVCISIDSEDALYVVWNWVVTHNTFTSIAWSHLIGDGPTMVVHSLSIVNKVWKPQLNEHYVTPPRVWSSLDNLPLTKDYDYYLVHYEFLQGNQYEWLKRVLSKIVEERGEKFKLILDESHNFNDIKAKQTQRLIALADAHLFQDALPMSGTAIKAQGSEIFTTMCLVDEYFDQKARQYFIASYGRNRTQLLDLLNKRIGRSKFTIPEIKGMGDPDPFSIVKVKVPNSDRYTLDAIRLEMQVYITDRIQFYNANMREFKLFYDETVNDYEESIAKQPGLLKDLERYKVIVARFRSKGYDNFKDSVDSRFCKDVEERIEARLKGKNLSDFRSIKSAVKYLGLKIRGEALGNVLGKARINAVRDLIAHANLPSYIDDVEKKTVIFTSYVDALKEASDYLTQQGYKMVSVYGETSQDRDKLITQFSEDPKVNPLGATYSSLKEGVPLIAANQIISLDAPWRDYEIKQVQARIWRRGQDSKCFFIMLDMDTGDKINITSRSIDIMEWSREQVEALLDKTAGHALLDKVTGQEMLDVSDEPSPVTINVKKNALGIFC